MKRWLVQTGDVERIVSADDVREAVITAMASELGEDDPGSLGLIAMVIEVADDADIYYIGLEKLIPEANQRHGVAK